jgi:hypothetical protein
MDETHNQEIGQPAKMSFKDLCIHLKLGDGAWDDIDWMADVPAGTLWKMLIGHPLKRKLAEKVLVGLSELDGETCWTLDNVEVTLLPTPASYFDHAFRQCSMKYQTLVSLAAHAGIAQSVIDLMIVGKPVYREEAEKVLALLSLHTDRVWSFDTIDVPLLAPPQGEKPLASFSAWEWGAKHERRVRALKKRYKRSSQKGG